VGQVLSLPENPSGTGHTAVAVAAARPAPKARPAVAPANSRARPRRLVVASWYGSQHHGKVMANGQPFNMYADTVAHRQLPLGTRLTLTNPQNGNTAQVQVTDRGPFIPGRDIDLSFEVARKLGVVKTGVAKLWMEGG
jgi:rare lipoprotein A (peptidoglycan hydrolase)